MFNLKAFLAGLVTVVIVGLTLQLAYVLIATYISSADTDGFFTIYQSELWFVSALTVYSLTMLAGGAVTAFFSSTPGFLTPAVVGLSTSLASLLASSKGDDISWVSAAMVLGSVCFCVLGSKFTWSRISREEFEEPV
ncbi:hypothetical protein [Neptunomonas sp.]|uniref:hypothetical protein n=1 Tax=Neptunomonas sp. TaxID=1971898 RepID=UPI0025F90DE9|nr:hypothetical protein [Neptunomonas sp.]